jgi:hypothetical protein
MATDPLVGVWRLISWENRSSDGAVSYLLGQDALGYIMYDHDGYMFVAIARRDRAKFAAGDLLRASTQEKAHAAETYISYCGRYDFYGDTVVHHVDLSLFPNWVDVDQERQVEVSGDRMTLSTRPMLLGGVQRRAHLIWERV